MKFKTIQKEVHTKFTEKGSKFLGHAYPLISENQAETVLKEVRKKYYDATHNCYAWRVGTGKDELFRYSDDGEPSGTAGKPIFDMLDKYGVTNLLVVVTRYFGGTKLGTGGLVRAYSHSAELTLSEARIITREIGTEVQIICTYEEHPHIMRILNTYPVISLNQDFSESVQLYIEIDEVHLPALRMDIQNATSGRVNL
ncbi:IMPACT family protein [Fidelibacter multiformis]|uniref:IMPACT family protein n=1 Tax=Fidelibacter multiformis TaxID=3377529 RepID=UPI0037DDA5F6